jgi:tetratricopeptide (TPR) repeat protein
MLGATELKGIKFGMKHAAFCAAALCIAMSAAGCAKLKARDHLNQGVNSFKTGNYSQAADEFHLAIDADPTCGTARLYLATAYMQQYVPGTDTPENKKFWQASMDEFQHVLDSNPTKEDRLLASQSIANLYFQVGNAKGPDSAASLEKAAEWNRKVTELDPKNKEAFYTLGVIPWLQFLTPDREARNDLHMAPEEENPLKPDTKKSTLKADLKAKYWQSLTDGIENEKKALAIDPMYENAMSYMNLLIRYRADLDDTKEQYTADVKEANDWVEKALDTQKIKAKQKADALASGASPSE